jgi:hypothetical protein
MFPRSILAGVWLALAAYAGPPLTTIQDILYKADGTRFNGILTISWSSFQAPDNSSIVTQSTNVKVVDGNLRVQLVPGTTSSPAVAYSVRYNSDGRVQFRETWSVPASAQPLRVRDVRVSSSSPLAADTGSGGTTVQESDVVGLVADLGTRPVKGPGFAAGRVAVVDSAGMLESASGSPTDCVRVDGSSGPCGDQGPSFVDGDTPSGIVDGSNASFTLSATPNPVASLAVYRNGLLQKTGFDYTLAGQAIQFAAGAEPQPGDTLLASYRLGGGSGSGGGGTSQAYPSPQVLCSGTGAATASATLASVGTCSIPGGILAPGDRVEVRFDLDHQGTAAAYSFEVHWGATVALHRDAVAADAQATGRVDASVLSSGAQLSTESWGTVLAFAAGVGSAPDAWSGGVAVDFQAKASGGDTVTLRNYTVVRLP